jgi:xylulokinase
VALVGDDGRHVATAEVGYQLDSPRPGWAETDTAAWDTALFAALDRIGPALAATPPRAVGLAGQMHGVVLCDEAGRALRPAIVWPDRRAADAWPDRRAVGAWPDRRAGGVLERWRVLPEPVRARLANPLVPGMTGPVAAWLAVHEPEVLARTAVLLLPKDHLRRRLGGPPVTDRSDASATLLWDMPADDWSTAAVRAAAIPDRLLPRVVGSADVVAETDLSATTLSATTLSAMTGVPVVAGSADTPAALLAAGPLANDAVQVNLGTGAQVLRTVDRPPVRADPPVHVYADTASGWYAMAAVQNAGLALDWVRRLFGLTWPDLFELAARAPAGAGGVSFLPFLTGERGGVAPAGSTAAWLGMAAGTSRQDLVRAAVEGMVFAVCRAVELLDGGGLPVRLTGGGGRSGLVGQLLADALAVPVRRVAVPSASATGAAMLAARGLGMALPAAPERGAELSPGPAPAVRDAYERWSDRLTEAP